MEEKKKYNAIDIFCIIVIVLAVIYFGGGILNYYLTH